jgi:hypothetical protein
MNPVQGGDDARQQVGTRKPCQQEWKQSPEKEQQESLVRRLETTGEMV